MQSLQGQLLVATTRLIDPNFYRTVVLIIQHDEEGAFGVVLNRPSRKSVSELWEEICDEPCGHAGPVYIGGPVSGPVLALHTDVVSSQDEILPGLFLAADRDQLRRLICDHNEDARHLVRVYVGYSGWGPGQLEKELAEGSWHVASASLDDVFMEGECGGLWETVTRRLGRSVLAPVLDAVPVPDDPSLN